MSIGKQLLEDIRFVPTKSILISKIKFDERNPNVLSNEKYEALYHTVEKYGFAVDPWLNDVGDGLYLVIDGEHRIKMLMDKGIQKVTCKIFKISYVDVQMLRQVANKLRGEHDKSKDAEEFKSIFDNKKLDEFAKMLGEPLESFQEILKKKFDISFGKEEKEIPEVSITPTTKLGDIYQLGEHRIMCGSSTNPDDMRKLCISNCTISFTSPPYNLGKNSKVTNPDEDSKYIAYKDNNPEYLKLLIDFTDLALSLNNFIFVNIQQLAANKLDFIDYLHHFKSNFVDVIIWDKKSSAPALAKNVLNSEFEYILIFAPKVNPSRSINTNPFHGTIQNIYHGSLNLHNEFADIHRAVFPLHLPQFIISNFSKKNDIILDSFIGTGTTLIAAEGSNRVCYGMELDPAYVDVIITRWENFTGKKAHLVK